MQFSRPLINCLTGLQLEKISARQLHHAVVGGIGLEIMVRKLSDYILNVRPVQGEQSQLVAKLYL